MRCEEQHLGEIEQGREGKREGGRDGVRGSKGGWECERVWGGADHLYVF